jgi:photosystem II stability/assembly factor-like uncharacterized protein
MGLFVLVLLVNGTTAAPVTYYLCDDISSPGLLDRDCHTSSGVGFASSLNLDFNTILIDSISGDEYAFDLYLATGSNDQSTIAQVSIILVHLGQEITVATTSFNVTNQYEFRETQLYTDNVIGTELNGVAGDELILRVFNLGPGRLHIDYGKSPISKITISGKEPPPAPSGLGATVVSQTQIDLSWTDNADDETNYRIEQSNGTSDWVEIGIADADTTSYSVTGLSCNSTNYYQVRAYRAGDRPFSSYSNIAGAITNACDPPATPSGLEATSISQTLINLSWIDNAANETNYRIERSPNGSNDWTEIGIAAANSQVFSDSDRDCGSTYFYRMRAFRFEDARYSNYSNVSNATTAACDPLPAPSELGATAVSQTQIDLSWTDNSDDETNFRIERSPDGSSGWAEIGSVDANVTSFSDNDLSSNTSYHYRVRAYRSADIAYSSYSNITTANTLTAGADIVVSSWFVEESNTNKSLNDVHFVDLNHGWLVGAEGNISQTGNGGETWTNQNSGVSENLHGVHFVDSSRGWTIGANGTIVTTNNGGVSWTTQTSGTEYDLEAVFFFDENYGWAGGGLATARLSNGQLTYTYQNVILRTMNGGASWTQQNDLGRKGIINDMHFINSQEGWAVGGQRTLLHTDDGGETWSSQTVPVDDKFEISGVTFIDANRGWIAGSSATSNMILYTENGGESWTAYTSEITTGIGWNEIYFNNSGRGWASGEDGSIIHTEDFGSSWIYQESHTEDDLYRLHMIDGNNGWAVGAGGTLMRYGPIKQIFIPMLLRTP